MYGYVFSPILLDRYIFFILIPIICFLSHFILKIKSQNLKIFLISLICISSFLNNLVYENSFKKFYTYVYPAKPEVKKALQIINSSSVKNYTFMEDNRYSINTNFIIQNYLLKCEQNLNLDLDYMSFDDKNTKPSKIWIIYIKDTLNEDFKLPNNFLEYKLIDSKFLNRLELNLLSM